MKTSDLFQESEAFRDHLSTVDKTGKRMWLYPKKPKGRFFNRRILATVIFLVLFFAGPFFEINGQPLLLINVLDRKFIILGTYFPPQDLILFGFGMIVFFVFIILFTVIYGRLWCGWFCPQTVFMEMVFRPIENWLEGSGAKQLKFDQSPISFNKIWRKGLKHLIYLSLSYLTAHVTMAYFIGSEAVLGLINSSPSAHLKDFIGVIVFTLIFYYVFAKLREQVCTSICPYGRLQGVLVNKSTSAILYDTSRGEPRHKLKKEEDLKGGHCIDCHLCVQVCPMGIDIRNGTQLECTNCTACIDACDNVMDHINMPRGLIRYTSQESVDTGNKYIFGLRAKAYSLVLLLLIGIESYILINRGETETTIMRIPGQLYQELPNGNLSNLYNAQIVNKTFEDIKINLKPNIGLLRLVNKEIIVKKNSKTEAVFFVVIHQSKIKKVKTPIVIEVFNGSKKLEKVKTNFMGKIN